MQDSIDRVRLAAGRSRELKFAARLWHRIAPRNVIPAIAVFVLCLSVYLITAGRKEIFGPGVFQQAIFQAHAFLHGQLDLVRYPSNAELAYVDGKVFVAAPPGPAVILIPFVWILGLQFSPVAIQSVLSAGSVLLLYLTLTARGVGRARSLLGASAFAFGTVLWWCTKQPGHWFTAHVAAVFFLTAALFAAERRTLPLWIGLLLGAASTCRQLTVLGLPYFVYRLVVESADSRKGIRRIAGFLLGLGIPLAGFLAFNYARFGNALETGYNHLYLRSPGLERYQRYGLFDLHYLPINLYTLAFAAPAPAQAFPFVAPSHFGQALVLTSPFLLYAFRASLRRREHLVLWICILLILIPQLLYFNNGFAQFGYRFALDFMPLLMLLTIDGWPERPTGGVYVTVALACLMNWIGVTALG